MERPLSSARLESTVLAEQPPQSYALPPQILVVDDDPDIRTVLVDLLESEGYHVTEASTAREALRHAGTTDFDAVLLDIGLPDADGLTVLSQLHAMIPALPVVIFTAALVNDQGADSLARGAFSYLHKPFDRDELRFMIRQAVGRSYRVPARTGLLAASVRPAGGGKGPLEHITKAEIGERIFEVGIEPLK